MLNVKVILIFLCFLRSIKCDSYSRNITDFSRCKVHYSRSESAYTTFFQITENFRANSSLIFDFHFSVLAPSDAHILISPSNSITRNDPVYEIVIGAGLNTFSDIRRLQKSSVRRTARTKDILSSLDVHSFWIHISKDGLIEVGKELEELPFLSWKDPDPLPIQVFSFNTWQGINAKWYYDCLREDGTASNSQEIEKPLTDIDRLKKDVLLNYNPYSRPILNEEDLTIIDIQFVYERIQLNDLKATMSIQGTMILKWRDEKILWDPENYDNITKLHIFHREIWLPNLALFNDAKGVGVNFLKSTLTEVSSDGWVTWKAFVDNSEVWCDASGIGSDWPSDVHTCEIQFGFLTEQNKFLLHTKLESKVTQSEWEVLDASSGLYLIPTSRDSEDDSDIRTYVMKFKLRRYSATYTAIYYAPLISKGYITSTICVSMLITFCVSPIGPYRISLNCLQLILLSLLVTSISVKVPHYKTSNIILLYCYAVFASIFSLAVSIIITNLTRVQQKKTLPQFLHKLLTSYYFKYILYTDFTKSTDSYDNMMNSTSTINKMDKQESWIMLGKIIDRILFFIYFIGICACIGRHY